MHTKLNDDSKWEKTCHVNTVKIGVVTFISAKIDFKQGMLPK